MSTIQRTPATEIGTSRPIDAGDPANPKARIAKRLLQTAGHVIRERVSKPVALGREDVPVSGEAITTGWLTAVLCRDHPGAQVLAVDVPGGSVGTSTRNALRLTYNEAGQSAGLPTDLYVKTTTSFTQRLVLGLASVLEGERGFYMEIRPTVDIEAPYGYWAAADPASWRSIAVIEDVVATKGASFVTPQNTPITKERMEDLLRSMATWHGAYWNDPTLGQRGWVKTASDHVRNITDLISFRKRSVVGAKRAERVMPRAIFKSQDRLWAGLGRSMELGSRNDQTFLHGDSHVGNTYVTAEGRMGWGDWQVTMQGSWGYDFAYAVTSALEVDDRRNWERDLLAFYLEELAAAGGQPPPFDEAFLIYRQQCFYPYYAWAFTIGRGALQPKFQPDEISLAIIERTSNAINDLESLEAVGV